MSKTTYLNLELTTDSSTHFEDYRKALNGEGDTPATQSNMQLIDTFAGLLSGGAEGQYLGKSSEDNFTFDWTTPDTTPTADSDKLVTSGGTRAAIDAATSGIDTGKPETVVLTGIFPYNLKPNVYYNFTGALVSLTLSFGEPIEGRENEYKGQFLTGDTVPTVTFPSNVIWVGEFPELESNKTYLFSVVNNIGVIVGV